LHYKFIKIKSICFWEEKTTSKIFMCAKLSFEYLHALVIFAFDKKKKNLSFKYLISTNNCFYNLSILKNNDIIKYITTIKIVISHLSIFYDYLLDLRVSDIIIHWGGKQWSAISVLHRLAATNTTSQQRN